jgi:hypothetical protein
MATFKFNSREREEIIRLVNLLNSTLLYVARGLQEIAASRILEPEYLKALTELTKEVRAEIRKLL